MSYYVWMYGYVPGRGFELYRLYDGDKRVDIEEMNNLANKMPKKAAKMDQLLTERLDAMNASYPFLNKDCKSDIAFKEDVCKVTDSGHDGKQVWTTYEEQGNNVTSAYLLYTLDGGQHEEEWYRQDVSVGSDGVVRINLPEGTTHYLFNFVDEHQFMDKLSSHGKYERL